MAGPEVVELAPGAEREVPLTQDGPPMPPLIVGPDSFTLTAQGKSTTFQLSGVLALGAEGLIPSLLWANLLAVQDLNRSFRAILDQTEAHAKKAESADIGVLAEKTFAAMAKQFPGMVPAAADAPAPRVVEPSG